MGINMKVIIRTSLTLQIMLLSAFFVLTSANNIFSETTENLLLEDKAQFIISTQINAFKNSNVNKAYSFASPFIKSKFANAEIFATMVKSSYPMIWAPTDYRFLEFTYFNASLIQRVLFIDENESIFIFDYELKNYGDDNWLINGVYQVKKSSSGA